MGPSNSKPTITLKLERAYLAVLRILILVFATLCLIGALIFVADGVRRAITSTNVEPKSVSVAAEEALGSITRPSEANKSSTGETNSGVSAEANKVHQAFMNGPFEAYYQAYRRLASTYNKPDDKVLDKAALANFLGYTAEALDAADRSPSIADIAAGDAAAASPEQGELVASSLLRTSKRFQRDVAYAKAQSDVVAKAIADPRLVAKAKKYKDAQKTSQSCTTEYRVRTVWDSNSTACSDWYYTPYGCSVRRAVPVQECVPAYPEGIESPLETFARVDESYRMVWASKMRASEASAATERSVQEGVKAAAPQSFMIGAWAFAAFLVVMFLFLLIAIERHMRPGDPA